MTYRDIAAAVTVVLLVAGCGTTSSSVRGDGSDKAADAETVNGGRSVFDAARLAEAPSASSLPDDPAGAVDDAGVPAFDASQDWKVVHQADDRVDLIRELDEPVDNGGGDVRTHESRTLERITGASNVPDGTWLLTSAGPCIPRLATGNDLGDGDLTVTHTHSPGDTSIDLFVHERACASGQSAEGRVELVALIETSEQVQLWIGVRPRPGGQDCQGNPPTPFTIKLDQPLGNREIVDVSVVPPRPVNIDANQ